MYQKIVIRTGFFLNIDSFKTEKFVVTNRQSPHFLMQIYKPGHRRATLHIADSICIPKHLHKFNFIQILYFLSIIRDNCLDLIYIKAPIAVKIRRRIELDIFRH